MPNIVVTKVVHDTVKLFYRARGVQITPHEKQVCTRLMQSWLHDIEIELAEYNGFITVFTIFNHEFLLLEAQNNVSTNQ